MKTILINILFLFIGLIALELIFGEWLIDNRLFLTRIPRDVQISFPVSRLYQSDTNAIYTRDIFGFRGDYPSPDRIDILTIGGSTTDQRYIDDSLTWQTHLSSQLSTLQNKAFTVVNAGIDGQTTYGHIANFEHWFTYIPILKPKFILFYIGLNDKWSPTPNGRFDTAVQPDKKTNFKLSEKTFMKSAFYNAWLNINGLFTTKGKPGHRPLDWDSTEQILVDNLTAISDQDRTHLEGYKRRIERLITLSRAMGAKVIIVNQNGMLVTRTATGLKINLPTGWNKEEAIKVARLESIFANETIETCKENGAICIDLFGDLEDQLTERYFYDLSHNNPQGTKLIGEYLAMKISHELDAMDIETK